MRRISGARGTNICTAIVTLVGFTNANLVLLAPGAACTGITLPLTHLPEGIKLGDEFELIWQPINDPQRSVTTDTIRRVLREADAAIDIAAIIRAIGPDLMYGAYRDHADHLLRRMDDLDCSVHDGVEYWRIKQ